MTVSRGMDVGYRISDKTLFRHPKYCQTPLSQSDIGSSDIRLSPISLITDIGLSAHLCRELPVLQISEIAVQQNRELPKLQTSELAV